MSRRRAMSKPVWNRYFIALAAITSLVLLVWIAGAHAAQNTVTGDWNASVSKDNSKLNLNVVRRAERGGRNEHGQNYDFSELQGLTREQALSGRSVQFRPVAG